MLGQPVNPLSDNPATQVNGLPVSTVAVGDNQDESPREFIRLVVFFVVTFFVLLVIQTVFDLIAKNVLQMENNQALWLSNQLVGICYWAMVYSYAFRLAKTRNHLFTVVVAVFSPLIFFLLFLGTTYSPSVLIYNTVIACLAFSFGIYYRK